MAVMMPKAPFFNEDDFRKAILALYPSGPIWPRDPDSLLSRLCLLLGRVYSRSTSSLVALLQDAFPGSTVELLPEWEKTLNLPEAGTGQLPTVEQRRSAVLAKLTDNGGSSVHYYILLARNSDFAITINEFTETGAGLLRAGDPVNGTAWNHTWRVSGPAVTVHSFMAGNGSAGEPLAAWGNKLLECLIRKRKPAHTLVIFAYSVQ